MNLVMVLGILVCMVHNELSDGVRYVGVYEFVNELINNNNVK